jgi:hypothetical protein
MTASIAIAFSNDRLLGSFFQGGSWDGWRTILRAMQGERLTRAEAAFFATVAGERKPPQARVKTLAVIAGRRSGKDSVASGIAAAIAAGFEPEGKLRPGERAVVGIFACDRAQSQICLGYLRSYFEHVPVLAAMVERSTDQGFRLKNSVDIEIVTSDHRSSRGRTYLAIVADEIAYWPSGDGTVNSDKEVIRALRPGLLTLQPHGALMILITTAYRKSGVAFDTWRKSFGKDDPSTLVIYAQSRQLNPLLPQAEIDLALEDDHEAGAADYLSIWRDDLSTFVARDLILSAIDAGVSSRQYDQRHRYVGFVDASSGRHDSFALAIAHRQDDVAVLDFLFEKRAPFNTAEVTAEVAALLKAYHVSTVHGDGYAAGWVEAEFQRHNIAFRAAKSLETPGLSPKLMDRSSLYLEVLPLLAGNRVKLLDNQRMIAQFCGLERRAMSNGRDKVDHPNRAGHFDDLSNAASGAVWLASTGAGARPMIITNQMVSEIAAAMGRRPSPGAPGYFRGHDVNDAEILQARISHLEQTFRILQARVAHLERTLRLREEEIRVLRSRIRDQNPVPQVGTRDLFERGRVNQPTNGVER